MVYFKYYGAESDTLKWHFEYMLLSFLLHGTPKELCGYAAREKLGFTMCFPSFVPLLSSFWVIHTACPSLLLLERHSRDHKYIHVVINTFMRSQIQSYDHKYPLRLEINLTFHYKLIANWRSIDF